MEVPYPLTTTDEPDYHHDIAERYDIDKTNAYARGNFALGALDADAEWIGHIDVFKAAQFRQNSYSDDAELDDIEIIFPNERFAALWELEITGQISDGVWENFWNEVPEARYDGWRKWCYADVTVDERATRIKIITNDPHDESLWHSMNVFRALTEHSGMVGRMIFYVLATCETDYDETSLMDDLRKLENAMFVRKR